MDATWIKFLRGAGAPEHAAHVYVEVDELAASVAGYLAAGFAAGEPAVVIATPAHWERFTEQLAGCGWDAGKVELAGLLVIVDAETTLDAVMSRTEPDPVLFEEHVGSVLAGLAERFPGKTIRAFGEMVNVLCERGQPAAAAALEDLWNDLALRHRFSLLCGYHQDAESVTEVCRSHSRVLLPAATTSLSLPGAPARTRLDVTASQQLHIRRDPPYAGGREQAWRRAAVVEARTPLTAIRGFAELLSAADVSAEARAEYLRTVLRECERLESELDEIYRGPG